MNAERAAQEIVTLRILGGLGLVIVTALVIWLVRKLDVMCNCGGDAPDCEECGHPMSEHDRYGHCQDECPCRLCDRETCSSWECNISRLAKAEYDQAKAHDRASCPCACCKFLRTRA